MKNLLSIIIPCYNQGHFIQDALDSIEEDKISYPLEIIIVNDGSTDKNTIDKINQLSTNNKYTIINQHNQGLAAARNNGIAQAKGDFVLPLDADNKITIAYINKGIEALLSGGYGIVYGKPMFFGDENNNRKYGTIEFNIYDLLERNYIDACAIYRKEVWLKNNGYDGGGL